MKITNELPDLLEFDKGLVDVNNLPGTLTTLQNRLVREINEKNLEIDCIYFSGEYPSIYFKKVKDFKEDTLRGIREIQKKIWNQGKVPFLYVDSPFEIRIYNCYHTPINPHREEQNISQAELFKTTKTDKEKLKELKGIFGLVAIETGQFWEKPISNKLTNKKRINKALIENLKRTRRSLIFSIGKDYENVVHDLLIRSLFVLYLEDRGATDKKLYNGYDSFLNILDDYKATYQLFEKLEKSFNGNLSPVCQEEKKIITEKHLIEIKACFWDTITDDNGQKKIPFDWKPFDFNYIPIELISEIYEEFLSEIEGEEQTSIDGAYYTPHILVEYILNKILPWAGEDNKNYNIKILDPTCGSGIFLVEALKRLIDRWEFTHPGKKIEFKDLTKILKNNIYGIEIKKEAIKVSAFSLYLTILDKLEPKTLWQQKKFPFLIYDPDDNETEEKGNNLFRMSSMKTDTFQFYNFDLVVGNPPFKRGRLKNEIDKYLGKKGYAKESAFAFLDKALEFCPNGKIAMIAPCKAVLFNSSKTYQNFRKFLFNETYVEEVINLSILRRIQKKYGGNLFAHAVGPSCVLFYQKQLPENISKTITYYAPKTIIKNNIIDGIVFDQTDIKYLPREECQKPDTKIWKIAMWGTERDFMFISRFKELNSLNQTISFLNKNGWYSGVGFETSHPCNKEDKEIKKIKHLPTKAIERYYTQKNKTINITFNKFRRIGAKKTYLTPHILIKESQGNQKFCASFIDYDCSFRKGVYGIKSTDKDTDKLKIIIAFLNSPFALYYFFLTASSWGIERDVVKVNEFLNLPDLILEIDELSKKLILDKINEIIKIKKTDFFNTENRINSIEKDIDKIIFKKYKINGKEKALIEDILNYNIDLFYNKDRSIARHKCLTTDSRKYAETLCMNINQFLEHGSELRATATIYDIFYYNPLNLTALHLKAGVKKTTIEKNSSTTINSILYDINNYTYKPETGTIYFRKIVKYYSGDTIYIIKPNEKRYWSRSMAMSDADAIIQEIVSKKVVL